jgi:hypothetical protein
MGRLTWEDIDIGLGAVLQPKPGEICGDLLLPLQRKLGSRWPLGLPSQPERCDLSFAAKVTADEGGQPIWALQWPEPITRFGVTGLGGLTKRVYEKYGSWNVLSVTLAEAGEANGKLLRELIARVGRGTLDFHLAGRTWRRPKARVAGGPGGRCELTFFAARAAEQKGQQRLKPHFRGREQFQASLDAVNDGPFLHWHLDPVDNVGMTLAKAVGRAALMHSSAVPTVVVAPEERKEVPMLPAAAAAPGPLEPLAQDQAHCGLRSGGGAKPADYTEGTGRVSEALMEEIHHAWLERSGKLHSRDDDGITPSTFQGRIGACKGVWSVDPALPGRALLYRPSQKKFVIRNPTPTQMTVEVCEFARGDKPGRLDLQVIRMLEPRLREPTVLVRRLRAQLAREAAALTHADAARRFCEDGGAGRQDPGGDGGLRPAPRARAGATARADAAAGRHRLPQGEEVLHRAADVAPANHRPGRAPAAARGRGDAALPEGRRAADRPDNPGAEPVPSPGRAPRCQERPHPGGRAARAGPRATAGRVRLVRAAAGRLHHADGCQRRLVRAADGGQDERR